MILRKFRLFDNFMKYKTSCLNNPNLNILSSHLKQFNMNAFHKPFWAWIFSVKRNPVWVKLPFSSWQRFSNSNRPIIMSTFSSCVIHVSSHSKLARNMSDSASICRALRWRCFLVECPFRRMKRH